MYRMIDCAYAVLQTARDFCWFLF